MNDRKASIEQAKREAMADRIRRAAQKPPCTCEAPDALTPEGRCRRCYGVPRERD